ncbi:looped-hinge helix DNA binding domain-containing protein, AbrB family [Candidatus Electrothrix marina]|uniref:Looped-hinge helix DNA binding domain-containing protein, AbrB family n=1 Tax=Candidatus Electrothrix marina TaxID=1859130 RepID=A0A444JFT9_9BACT|nr:looped-hinge helix DNA binding domain-containing protein, AbrB family [Candidatus Electrothrix marina]
MQTQAAKLSSKGNIAIPKEIIARRRWKTGQKLELIDTEEGILLKAAPAFKSTRLDDVAGMLRHSGKTVSLKEMEEAVRQGAQERK